MTDSHCNMAWTYWDDDDGDYVPRLVEVLYGPDANGMYVILKDNGVTDRTGILMDSREKIEAFLAGAPNPVDAEPELCFAPRPRPEPGTLTDEELAFRQRHAEDCLTALHRQYTRIGTRVVAVRDEFETLRDEVMRRSLAIRAEAGLGPDWSDLLRAEQGEVHRQAGNAALAQIGLSTFGYYPDTMQRCVEFGLSKGDAAGLEFIQTGIEALMPALLPVSEGWCCLNIRENSLSYDGTYNLRFKPNGQEFQLTIRRYGRLSVLKSFDSLRAALAYVQENLPDSGTETGVAR